MDSLMPEGRGDHHRAYEMAACEQVPGEPSAWLLSGGHIEPEIHWCSHSLMSSSAQVS